MTEVLPAILGKDPEEFRRQAQRAPAGAEMLHIDVLEDDVWSELDKDFEAHLMVWSPERIVGRWLGRGAKRIIAHELLALPPGVEFGLGIELEVPLEGLWPNIEKADFVHLMSIRHIGAQGRPFEPEVFDRIREVKKKFPQKLVSVDGGVSAENAHDLIEAGADRLVAGKKIEEVWNLLMKG